MKDLRDPLSRPWLETSLLVGAAALVYANSFAVPFLLDDHPSIVENPTIRRLWPPWDAFAPPVGNGYTVGGRPLLNFTFALNYAVSGTAVWSYHALNVLIHILAALTLFGVLRRSFARLERVDLRARWIPLGVALLWLLHPLQTQSVTYIVQRAESLVSLFYLLTLYCFVRGAEPAADRGWHGLSVVACLLGVLTKEVMATAPLLVLLYDRTFVAGSLEAAWHARQRYYLALASTWMVLAALVAGTDGRGGSVGADGAITWMSYAFTQCAAIMHYLRLVVWPRPLVFDYGTAVVHSAGEVILPLVLIVALMVAVVLALRTRPRLGFLGASFFVLLAPSSSVVPIVTQTMSEHRMYLALAPVLVLLVLAAQRWFGQRALVGLVVLGAGAGALTMQRNQDYRTEFSIWQDTVQKRPNNARAQNELGKGLFLRGQLVEALPAFERAVQLSPAVNADYVFNLALTLNRLNRPAEARLHYESVVRLRPRDPEAWNHLGLCLAAMGHHDGAIAAFKQALELNPHQGRVQFNLAESWFAKGNHAEAAASYREALRHEPANPAWHHFHGLALAMSGRTGEAAAEFERALELRPDFPEAKIGLARARAELKGTIGDERR